MEKPKRRRKEDDGSVSSPMDRISELPDPVLQHILSFLSQIEAVQTSVLSQSWRHLWSARSTVEFRQNLFRGNTKTFLSILDQTLERYRLKNLSFDRFVVEMSSLDYGSRLLLEKLVPTVLNKGFGVETFHLIYPEPKNCLTHALPSAPAVFQAEFLKELHLGCCKIESTGDKLCLNRLKTLSLDRIRIEDETLEKIITSCPLIEDVDLYMCSGLKTVKVNNLKHFVCSVYSIDIEVEVPSALEKIRIHSCFNFLYDLDNHHFSRLKSLYLYNVQLSEKLSGIFSCNSPCLEVLDLRRCHGFKEVEILSRSVKRIIIMDTLIMTITVDAPGILYFQFSCCSSLPSISFTTVASSEWKSNVSVLIPTEISSNDISPWFLKLYEVVKALRSSQIALRFLFGTMMDVHIEATDHVGYYEPVVVENVDLGVFVSSVDFSAMFDWLFRFFRPRYICMRMDLNPDSNQSFENNKLAEVMCKTNLNDAEFSRCFFWQQELKELSLELWDHDSKKWCLVQGLRLPAIASPKIRGKHRIRFVFDWSEGKFDDER